MSARPRKSKARAKPAPEASPMQEFLAAPEQLLKSESERRKAASRKAKLLAEQERERASKATEAPSVEDMLADMIRVAEDEETNPYAKFRTLSAKRYALFGHYPIEFLHKQFGQFEHAKQVAGLEDQPGDRTWKAARAASSRREHAARYAERWILPYVAKRELPSAREAAGTELVLSISDTHATYLDPFTWYCFLRACRDLQPSTVVLNGDILEGSEITRHPKIPGRTIPLQLEFDFAREMFRQLRELLPDARIVWGAGNHGLDRLASYLTQVAPALANLRSLRFDQLAGLDGLRVELAQGGKIASPIGTEDDQPGILLRGHYRVYHGTKLGAQPAYAELQAARRSGQSGHVHRAAVAYGTTEAEAALTWMSTPMGCTPKAGRAYMPGLTTGWQRGFGAAFLLPGGRVHHYPIVTDGEECFVEGYRYRRSDIPAGEPDPLRLWLPDLVEKMR